MLDRRAPDRAAPRLASARLPSPRRRAAALASGLALASVTMGCSGGETAPAATGASTSGPTGTERFGAVNLEIYEQATQTCPAGNARIDIGNVRAEPPETVTDGFGASVTCTVAPVAVNFQASGSIAQGNLEFAFSDLDIGGASAIGKVSLEDPASGTRYESTTAKPCVFQFLASAGQSVAAGRISVGFDCAELVSETNSTETCSVRLGYLLLDRCNTVP